MGIELWLAALIFGGGVILFLGSGLWIGAALGVIGVIGILVQSGTRSLALLGSLGYNLLDNYALSCLPLYLLMGELFLHAGLSDRFYKGLMPWIQRLPGGLTQTNIAACTIFAAITGSSMACAAAIGTVAIPEMRKRGYANELILGSLASGGTLGILIPPSIAMIIYASMVEASVGKLFIGGIVPGVLLASMFSCYIAIRAKMKPSLVPRIEASSWKERLAATKNVAPASAIIIFIMVSIYLGICTPVEAGAFGAAGVLAITFMYRVFNWKMFKESLHTAVRICCMAAFIMFGAQIMSFSLVNADVPRRLAEIVGSLSLPPYIILILIFLFYAVLGCFLDGLSMMLLTLPILYPIVIGLGFDQVWFGVFLVIVIELSLLTPPVGMNAFVIQAVAKVPVGEVFKATIPYWILLTSLVALITVFPDLTLWLPNHMIGK